MRRKIFFVFLFIFFILYPCVFFQHSHILDDRTLIEQELYKYKNRKLLRAMIKVESNFNKKTVSPKGALGLMQIIPKYWHDELTKVGIIEKHEDYFCIERNIKAGDYILTKYINSSKNLKTALKKYSGNAKNYYNKVKKEMK